MARRPPAEDQDPGFERRAGLFRRVGYVLFGLITGWVVVSLTAGVVGGLLDGEITDPFSGRSFQEEMADCQSWGHELQTRASHNPQVARQLDWRMQVDGWMQRCERNNLELARELEAQRGPARVLR